MASFLKQLFFGKTPQKFKLPVEAYKNQIIIIKQIWNNETYNDFGIERIFRLFIAISQLFFPALLLRSISGRGGYLVKKIAIEFYVLLKFLLPIAFLAFGLAKNEFVFIFTIYLILETLFYLANVVFLSDINTKRISYKGTILLIFLNYLEITISFAVLYSHGNYLNKIFKNDFEAVYFSFITTATIGYGDFSPATTQGQILVIFQSIFFLAFLGIFLNFFTARIEDPSYYNNDKTDKR